MHSKRNTRIALVMSALIVITLLVASGCQQAPEVIEKEVVVEKPVVQTVVVEKEIVVTPTPLPEVVTGQLDRNMAIQVFWNEELQRESSLQGDTWAWIMPADVHQDSRDNGGTLDVVADRAVVCRFESAINSVITVDGIVIESGNWAWGQNDVSLVAGQHLVFNLGPAPNQGVGVWCRLSGVTAPVAAATATPRPSADPTATPTAPPAQLAWGSCTIQGVQKNMLWDGNKGVLYGDPWVGELKKHGGQCHLNSTVSGKFNSVAHKETVPAQGNNIELAAGDYYFSYDPSESAGWSWTAN